MTVIPAIFDTAEVWEGPPSAFSEAKKIPKNPPKRAPKVTAAQKAKAARG
jgi:hypothetical protein